MLTSINRRKSNRRLRIALHAVLLTGAVAGTAIQAQPTTAVQRFHIAAGSLGQALNQFTAQSGMQLLYDPALVRGDRVDDYTGTVSVRAALNALLKGTGLVYQFTDANTVVVKRSSPKAPAHAMNESDDPPPPKQESSDSDQAANLGKIKVTGTRIRAASYETSKPVVRVSRQELDATGQRTLAGALQQLPTVGASYNGQGTIIQTASVRGISGKRTLVLLNGHRWITDPNGLPDLNAIPISIIDHVDVLTAGASPVYGSDALGGVINVITIKDFNGAEASAYYGVHTGDGHWDGHAQKYYITAGASGDRYGAVVNLSYETEGAIPATNRDLTKEPTYGTGHYFGTSFTPQGRFRFFVPPSATINPMSPNNMPNPAVTGLTSAQCPTMQHGDSYLPTCDLTLKSGRPGTSASDFRPFKSPEDLYTATQHESLLVPQNKKSIYTQLYYNISKFLKVHATGYVANERAIFHHGQHAVPETQIAPGSVNADIAASNPFNPFGFALNASGDKNTNVFSFDRRLAEEGPPRRTRALWSMYFDGGLRGDFVLGGRSFQWNTDYTWDHLDEFQGVAQKGAYGLFTSPLLKQLNGNLSQCTRPCVPFNLFGGQYHGGTITPAMLSYSKRRESASRPQSQQQIEANLTSSDIVDLPAGPLGLALGYAHQTRVGEYDASSGGRLAYGNSVKHDYGGSYHKDAVYGEIKIPLLKDLPFVDHLDVDYAARYSHYSTFGGTVNSSGGFRWKPTQDLLIRGTIAQGFRAPQLSDLYVSHDVHYPNIIDICDSSNRNRPAACTTGLGGIAPVPVDYQQAQKSTYVVYGGNPNLNPETSLSKTLGFVYSPAAVPGLSVKTGYWSVNIGNQIGILSPQKYLRDCYLLGDLSRCEQIHRDSNGSIAEIDRLVINHGNLFTDGVDFSASYRIPFHDFGDFSLKLNYTYTRDYITSGQDVNNIDGSHSQQSVGFSSHPRNKANLGINWNLGNWSATYRIIYIGHSIADCSRLVNNGFPDLCTDPEDNVVSPAGRLIPSYRLSPTVYNDAQISRVFSPINTTLTVGLNNLFGEQPPKYNGLGLTGFYRVPGRFLYARLTTHF